MSSSKFRECLNVGSPFWEKCCRHESAQTARATQVLYLCDPCAMRMMKEAMNERPPIYHGETVNGFCGLCNEPVPVTLRMYFACPFCWNVIVAYQKAFVACKAVHDYWAAEVARSIPKVRLTETEVPYLSSYARSRKTKKAAASELKYLDFLVEEIASATEPTALFHIELKAGPGSVDEMSEFQLDINDSNDIIAAVNNTGLPAYIFHVQLNHEYKPPTRRTAATTMWFTDIATLVQNRVAVRQRRGDQKNAGYYRPSAFQPITNFVSQLKEQRYEQLKKKLASKPLTLT